jgi:hypothetical protein
MSVFERLLSPAAPGWVNHAGIPDDPAYDALETLAWIAAKTDRVRLHTAILVPLFQRPAALARRDRPSVRRADGSRQLDGLVTRGG